MAGASDCTPSQLSISVKKASNTLKRRQLTALYCEVAITPWYFMYVPRHLNTYSVENIDSGVLVAFHTVANLIAKVVNDNSRCQQLPTRACQHGPDASPPTGYWCERGR